jgi:hypothetical protein
MAEPAPQEPFSEKYGNVEKIWSGDSFIKCPDLRALLAELPVSAVAYASRTYTYRYMGNLEAVFGELVFDLLAYEGYLKDKAFPIIECSIKPVIGPSTIVLAFDIHYKTKAGEERTRSSEVIRHGDRGYLFFTDKYRVS